MKGDGRLKIDIIMLKKIVDEVCEKYCTKNKRYLEPEIDYFCYIEMEEGIDFQKEPRVFVASLDDDYHSLEQIEKDSREVNIVDLDRISNIFKAISYEIEHQNDKFL